MTLRNGTKVLDSDPMNEVLQVYMEGIKEVPEEEEKERVHQPHPVTTRATSKKVFAF
jgi:hypothetical protein